MMKSKTPWGRQFFRVAAFEGIGVLCQILVYLFLGKLTVRIAISSLVGGIIVLAMFWHLGHSVGTLLDRIRYEQVEGKKKETFVVTVIRLLAVFAIDVVLIKLGWCDALALILPLLYYRPSLLLQGLFRKDEEAT